MVYGTKNSMSDWHCEKTDQMLLEAAIRMERDLKKNKIINNIILPNSFHFPTENYTPLNLEEYISFPSISNSNLENDSITEINKAELDIYLKPDPPKTHQQTSIHQVNSTPKKSAYIKKWQRFGFHPQIKKREEKNEKDNFEEKP
ncbi:uncharacterized protein LOC123302412 [Chrysoperla carnea]|uniref:uncharacterized protein LOC123302412 n=1 Tax=Chrysoperla carnea TaxID=189513 RepID=UPI001D061425|nr:uncharacterized protein LOC123302412 [Chrysoperla carnea]